MSCRIRVGGRGIRYAGDAASCTCSQKRLQLAQRACMLEPSSGAAGVLQAQHLFSVYIHPLPEFGAFPEGSIFRGREIADRIQVLPPGARPPLLIPTLSCYVNSCERQLEPGRHLRDLLCQKHLGGVSRNKRYYPGPGPGSTLQKHPRVASLLGSLLERACARAGVLGRV